MEPKRRLIIWLVGYVALGSGVLNVLSVVGPSLPERLQLLKEIFPLEFISLSRFAVLLVGLALVIVSINIWRRKRRAFVAAVGLAILSIAFHLAKGLDYEEAVASVLLLVLLGVSRRAFTVRSGEPDLGRGVLRLLVALILAVAYGIAGFWLLDEREFGVNFHLGQAVAESFRYLTFMADPALVPRTEYASWFLDSLYLISLAALLVALWALFRPVRYLFHVYPEQRARARVIAEAYGRHDLDFFKLWPDKSYFFEGDAFLAYRVGAQTAVVLGDPVGPEDEIEPIVRSFKSVCDENDWALIFHQTLPDFLPVYEKLGFGRVKIGDDAIVDLTTFSLQGASGKGHRYVVNRVEKRGIHVERYAPPLSDEILRQCQKVSDEWLGFGGHRERGFTLGRFEPRYLQETIVLGAIDETGQMQAFINIIPSFRKGEATVDLMRRRAGSLDGIMDYLFIKAFLMCAAEGYVRFTLGMAPMAGFREGEAPSPAERLLHIFVQQLGFLFRFKGIYTFKAKYAHSWEPRYVILDRLGDLPRHALAIRAVAEL